VHSYAKFVGHNFKVKNFVHNEEMFRSEPIGGRERKEQGKVALQKTVSQGQSDWEKLRF
jgi:hypothetical protein